MKFKLKIAFILSIAFLFFEDRPCYGKVYTFQHKLHFTQGRFKIDNQKYRYINSRESTVFKGPKGQIFELDAIKSKDLTFYTLTVKRKSSLLLLINDFGIMSKTSKIRMLKEGWITDLDKDGYFDIVQREKTFILNNRAPASNYSNDKLKVKVWSSKSNMFIEKEKNTPIYIKSLKNFNFKMYTLYKGKVI